MARRGADGAIEYDESAEIRLLAEMVLSQRDRERLLERHLQIKRDDGPIQLIGKLKPSQKKLLRLIKYLRERGEAVRIIILKARKAGTSTAVEADMFAEVLEREIDGLVIAHDVLTSRKIFDMTQLYYERYDLPNRPRQKKMNARELRFFDHHGRIDVETANNKFAGTGTTPQYLHSSETSKWQAGAETAISLLQSVATKPGTTIIHESTANGYDDLFYPMWRDAWENCEVTFDADYNPTAHVKDYAAWNYYYPLFISVFDDPECSRAFPSDDDKKRFLGTLDASEEQLLAGEATPEYLNYRRFTIKNQCQNDIDIYHQEHPETPHHAFLASGRPRFNRSLISLWPVETGRTGKLEEKQIGWRRSLQFVADPQEFLTVYRDPVPGHRYVLGTDTSEGKIPDGCRKPDATVAMVIDIDHGCEQCAVISGQISEENVVPYLDLLGRHYNLSFQIPETNSTGKVVAINLPNPPYNYPRERFYHKDDWNPEKSRHVREIGWRTHETNRHHLISVLANAINENAVIVYDRRTREECNNFVWKDGGRAEAQKGFHDDHVFALALALMGAKSYPMHLKAGDEPVEAMLAHRVRNETADPVTGY